MTEIWTNYGWANSWKETPERVLQCREAKHAILDKDVGPPNRGLEHVVRCSLCQIVYRYDSSD